MAEQVAQKVHPAPLPASALEHAPDRRRQPKVGIGDHKPGPVRPRYYCCAEAFG